MKITIVGCGNSGLVHAAKLIEKGFEVALLKTSDSANSAFFELMCSEGGFNVKDETSGGGVHFAKPAFITKDAAKAIPFADVIMVMTTTLCHEDVARKIAPHVRDGQVIAIVPGYMGSLIFKRYIKKDVIYSEWETTAYNGRIMDSLYVRITFYNPRNAVSVLPANKSGEVLAAFSSMFENTKYLRRHILESALHNPNMIVHPIGMLFSAARIEHSGGEFWMYKEAFTPSVINVIRNFDAQKNRLLEIFDCEPLDYFEAAKWRNERDLSIDAMTVFKSFSQAANKGPSLVRHRYLMEDVPNGLGLFSSIGKAVNTDTSIADAIITLAGSLLQEDFRKNARTIEYLLDKERVSEDDIRAAIL